MLFVHVRERASNENGANRKAFAFHTKDFALGNKLSQGHLKSALSRCDETCGSPVLDCQEHVSYHMLYMVVFNLPI